MKKNKHEIIIILVGLLLIAIGFLIHLSNRYRLIFILVGFIIQIIGMSIDRNKKWLLIPILIIIFGFGLVYIDYLCVVNFDKLPVLAIRQTISSKSKVYNALFYRVWNCDISDNKIYVDNFYKSSFYCDSSELKKVSVNDFLLHFEKKYKENKNHYIKIEGKISKIEGLKSLEMASYEYEVDALNGYVTFDENVKLKFTFNQDNKDLANYSVYDNVKVIGKVSRLQKNQDNQYTIILVDSKLVENTLYDDFSLIVDPDENCSNDDRKLLYAGKDNNFYQSCLNSFEIKYSEEDIYSLEYILQDNKVNINDIYKKANSSQSFDDGGSKLYFYDNFNILACNTSTGSKDVYFGNTNLTYNNELCPNEKIPEESEEVPTN